MLQLPMIPNWDGLHLLLIHFPLTLFLLAPFFALLALVTNAASRRTFLISTLVVMLLGIASMHATFEAGEAAASTIFKEEIRALVEHHKDLAALARSSLAVATLLFGLALLLCICLRLRLNELTGVLPFGSATFYAFGLYWLIHAAYQGERLVHEFGAGAVVNP